jgi:hypothetical protein
MSPSARTISRIIAFLTVWLVVSGFGFSSRAPQAWENWDQSNPQDNRVIEHGEWALLLTKYIKPGKAGLNTFAYGKVSAADKAALKNYIGSLEAIEVTGYNKNEQLAYWINLYNAVTIRVVLDHYPVKTIRDVDISGFLKNGPWQKELVTVEETPLTLDDIEHAILRPIWKDPRIHYGVNCASVGCPNLQTTAFTGKTASAQLDAGAKAYINSTRGIVISKRGNASVSSIYSWFAHDIGNSEGGVMQHLLKFANPDLAEKLTKAGRLSDTHYDWSLNE